jgi:hypothetical protein
MIQIQSMQKIKLDIKNRIKIMDKDNFPTQCHPLIKLKKKKLEKKENETV